MARVVDPKAWNEDIERTFGLIRVHSIAVPSSLCIFDELPTVSSGPSWSWAVCDYCKTEQEKSRQKTNCVNCGAPLPLLTPEQRFNE